MKSGGLKKFMASILVSLRSDDGDLVEGVWGEFAVAMARKIALRKLARRRVFVAPFPVEV